MRIIRLVFLLSSLVLTASSWMLASPRRDIYGCNNIFDCNSLAKRTIIETTSTTTETSTATASARTTSTTSERGKTPTTYLSMSSLSSVKSETESNDTKHVRVLGVCGGIGSGKSMACKLLVNELGCIAHIEADSVAHTVYEPNSPVINEIAEEFGSDILLKQEGCDDQIIDRKKLGALVFSNPQALQKLERLVWPHVKDVIKNKIIEFENNWQHKMNDKDTANDGCNVSFPVIIVEAAVMLDAGWEDILDGIWVVTTPKDIAIERLVQNRGFSPEDAQTRVAAQESRRGIGNIQEEVKNNVVTAIIENTGTEEELKESLLRKLNDPTAWK